MNAMSPASRRLRAIRSAILQQHAAATTTIYDELGVPTIINANGPSTRLSGGIPRPEVVEAMAHAAESCVERFAVRG